MALRDKLAARSQPLLPPGSQIRHTFVCQTGPSPWFFLLTYLILFWIQYRIVAVTDDAIYVLRSSKLMFQPKELVATLPRQTQLGPVSGLWWAKIELMGERHWVHRRFYKDIEAADYEARQYGAPAQPPAPPAAPTA